MNNIEKIAKLKAIAILKVAYHKEKIMDIFEERKIENEFIKLVDGSIGVFNSAKQVYESVQEIDEAYSK